MPLYVFEVFTPDGEKLVDGAMSHVSVDAAISSVKLMVSEAVDIPEEFLLINIGEPRHMKALAHFAEARLEEASSDSIEHEAAPLPPGSAGGEGSAPSLVNPSRN